MSGTIGDSARFLQMLLRRRARRRAGAPRGNGAADDADATGNMPTLRGPGWSFTLGFGIVIDPAAAKSRLPAGSYGWGGIHGTQFWIDPATASSA